jgi:glycerol uptake facilitator protein
VSLDHAAMGASPKKRLLLGGLYGECLSEFLGTFVLIAFGDGVVALAVVGLPQSGRQAVLFGTGNWILIVFGWFAAVALGVYVAGGVSGAHINPAVTLAFAVRRKFPWKKVLPYWGAQVVGAFAGAAIVYADFQRAIGQAETISSHTSASLLPRNVNNLPGFSIFATFPAGYYHGALGWPFLDQVIGTAFLLMFVAALIDTRNTAPMSNLGPFMIGFAVLAIGLSFGTGAGYAINPARDFGPRLFAFFLGWGHIALPGSFTSATNTFSGYFWVPIVGPLVGGVIGIVLYDLFIVTAINAKARLAAEVPAGEAHEELREVPETAAGHVSAPGESGHPEANPGDAPPRRM